MEAIFFLFVNAVKMYQFKTKDSEIRPCPQCLGNIFQKILHMRTWKKEDKRKCESFSVDYNPIDTSDIFNIHRYLMKKA